jgi:hypothetical protein
MKRSIASVCVGSALVFSAAAPMPVDAAMKTEYASYNAALACQLSLPTIDTKVSPRATGFRNDGTSGTFVICGASRPTDDGFLIIGTLSFKSFDSVAHSFDCTAVTGQPDSLGQIVYKTKTVALAANAAGSVGFSPPDYGGGTSLPDGFSLSITCALPPHVSITTLATSYQHDIGT